MTDTSVSLATWRGTFLFHISDDGFLGGRTKKTYKVTNVLGISRARRGQRPTKLETTRSLSIGEGLAPEGDASAGMGV